VWGKATSAGIKGKSIQWGSKERHPPLEEAITMNAVVSYWNLIVYCIPVASLAFVLSRCFSRAAHADNCMDCQGSVVGQLQTELMMLRNLSMASS
jgi:hypothetical protein